MNKFSNISKRFSHGFVGLGLMSLMALTTTIPWGTTVYNGYGTVTWNTVTRQLTETPKAATQPSETHAALVVSNRVYKQPYQISFTMKTLKQLRTGSVPNPWEVGWFGFGYNTKGQFKYLILKPNGYGLELGESLLNNQQNFLYTSPYNQDNFPINTNYNVIVKVANNIVTVTVNGKQYLKYTMTANDVLTPNGQYAFYTEDASTAFSNIVAKQL